MRTTVAIDDDVLLAARERARRERRSVGAVLSDLARSGLRGQREEPGPENGAEFLGFRPLPRRGGLVTNTLIDELRDDEDR